MSIQIYQNSFVPKYENGHWTWNEVSKKLEFHPFESTAAAQCSETSLTFKKSLTQTEEIIFIQKFQRSSTSSDSDVIILQDIKDLVLFLVSFDGMPKNFIEFFHTKSTDQFLSDLIIYFAHFLKLREYLVEHKRTAGDRSERSQYDTHTERTNATLSAYLSQYRLLLARDYGKIVLGEEDSNPFHHMKNKLNRSYFEKDRDLFETLLAFSTEIVWIAMHRRHYKVVGFEINRLFRSHHYNSIQLNTDRADDSMNLAAYEQQLLYGRNNQSISSLSQNSPVICEILNVDLMNQDLLWLGLTKFNCDDDRIQQLEFEYVTNSAQLYLVDVQHGILGHPKRLYDTMLNIDWTAVRREKFSPQYDPYRLVTKQHLQTPNEGLFKLRGRKEPLFKLQKFYDEQMISAQLQKWTNKSKMMESLAGSGDLIPSILKQAEIFAKTPIE